MVQHADGAHRGFKSCSYKKGDWVWHWYSPKATDKLDPTPFMGPYHVIKYDEHYHVILLKVLCPRQGHALAEKWIYVSKVKQGIFNKDGKLLTVSAGGLCLSISTTCHVEVLGGRIVQWMEGNHALLGEGLMMRRVLHTIHNGKLAVREVHVPVAAE